VGHRTDRRAVGTRGRPASGDKPLTGRLRSYSRVAGAIGLGVAGLVLFGWWLKLPIFTSVVPGLRPMAPNSALMGVLSSMALLLLSPPSPRPSARFIAKIASMLVCLIAGLTLFEYAAGIDLGIDQLLVPSGEPTIHLFPGRPGPNSALTFLSLGTGLLLLDYGVGRRFRPAEAFIIAAGAIPTIALLGYLLGADALYGIPALLPHSAHVALSIPSAVVMLLLASGTLTARPDSGFMAIIAADDLGGVVARRLLSSLAIFPPVAIALVVGARAGHYSTPSAIAFLLFFALVEGIAVVVITSSRVARLDSEIKHANMALQRSESRVRAFLERASDGIFIADLEGRYTDVNQAGHRMLGYSDGELVGRRIVDIIPREDLGRLERERKQMLEGGSVLSEWNLRRKEGDYLPVEVNATILPGGDWQAIVRDISERKLAERALTRARDGERRARISLERVTTASFTISDALASLRETGLESALRTIVLQVRSLTGAKYAALGIGGDPERPFDPWIYSGTEEDVGPSIRAPDLRTDPGFRGMPPGHPMMHGLLDVPILYKGKTVGNFYLTEKEGADEFTAEDEWNVRLLATRTGAAIELARLYEDEALQRTWLQALFDSMPESVVITDETGRVIQQNHAAQQLAVENGSIALSGDVVPHDVRSPSGERVSPEDLPVSQALLTGEPVVGKELAIRGPSGRMIPIVASATPVSTARGPKGAIVVFQDISALKEIERLRE